MSYPTPPAMATAAAVRAEMARQNKRANDLAPVIQTSRSSAQRRLSGETQFTIEDLDAIASWLDLPVATLLPCRRQPATFAHTFTRYTNGHLDGEVQCSWSGDVEQVDWRSRATGRPLPPPANHAQLDGRTAMCRACGHTIPLEGVEP